MKNDLTLYQRYRDGDKGALSEVFKQYDPLISGTVAQYANTGLNPEALNMEARRIVVKSLKTYDPSKGNLTSHLQNNMKSMFRETNKANKLYIPEARAVLYGKYKNAHTDLSDRFGRAPADVELADNLKIGVKDIRRLAKETGVNITSDTNMYDDDYDMPYKENPDIFIKNLRKELTDPIDRAIMDSAISRPKPMTNKDIGKITGISEGAVRQRKDKMIKLIRGME